MKGDIQLLLECIKCQLDSPGSLKQALVTIASICTGQTEAQAYLRECGGLQYIIGLLTSTSCPQVQKTALYTLGCAVEGNVFCQKELCTGKMFTLMFNKMCQPGGVALSTIHPAVYLLLALVANNGTGQVLVKKSGCLQKLLELFRECLPRGKDIPEEKWFESELDGASVELWAIVASALCVCVNNPQNEENQQQCVTVFPQAFRFLQDYSQARVVRLIASFLGLAVANNVGNQDRLEMCGGLEGLVNALRRAINQMDRDAIQRSVAVCLTSCIDAAVTDHVHNAVRCGRLGVIPLMLQLLSAPCMEPAAKVKVVVTLGHCTDASVVNQVQLVDHGGMKVLIQQLEVNDGELSKTIKYVLQTCVGAQGVTKLTEPRSVEPTSRRQVQNTTASQNANCKIPGHFSIEMPDLPAPEATQMESYIKTKLDQLERKIDSQGSQRSNRAHKTSSGAEPSRGAETHSHGLTPAALLDGQETDTDLINKVKVQQLQKQLEKEHALRKKMEQEAAAARRALMERKEAEQQAARRAAQLADEVNRQADMEQQQHMALQHKADEMKMEHQRLLQRKEQKEAELQTIESNLRHFSRDEVEENEEVEAETEASSSSKISGAMDKGKEPHCARRLSGADPAAKTEESSQHRRSLRDSSSSLNDDPDTVSQNQSSCTRGSTRERATMTGTGTRVEGQDRHDMLKGQKSSSVPREDGPGKEATEDNVVAHRTSRPDPGGDALEPKKRRPSEFPRNATPRDTSTCESDTSEIACGVNGTSRQYSQRLHGRTSLASTMTDATPQSRSTDRRDPSEERLRFSDSGGSARNTLANADMEKRHNRSELETPRADDGDCNMLDEEGNDMVFRKPNAPVERRHPVPEVAVTAEKLRPVVVLQRISCDSSDDQETTSYLLRISCDSSDDQETTPYQLLQMKKQKEAELQTIESNLRHFSRDEVEEEENENEEAEAEAEASSSSKISGAMDKGKEPHCARRLSGADPAAKTEESSQHRRSLRDSSSSQNDDPDTVSQNQSSCTRGSTRERATMTGTGTRVEGQDRHEMLKGQKSSSVPGEDGPGKEVVEDDGVMACHASRPGPGGDAPEPKKRRPSEFPLNATPGDNYERDTAEIVSGVDSTPRRYSQRLHRRTSSASPMTDATPQRRSTDRRDPSEESVQVRLRFSDSGGCARSTQTNADMEKKQKRSDFKTPRADDGDCSMSDEEDHDMVFRKPNAPVKRRHPVPEVAITAEKLRPVVVLRRICSDSSDAKETPSFRRKLFEAASTTSVRRSGDFTKATPSSATRSTTWRMSSGRSAVRTPQTPALITSRQSFCCPSPRTGLDLCLLGQTSTYVPTPLRTPRRTSRVYSVKSTPIRTPSVEPVKGWTDSRRPEVLWTGLGGRRVLSINPRMTLTKTINGNQFHPNPALSHFSDDAVHNAEYPAFPTKATSAASCPGCESSTLAAGPALNSRTFNIAIETSGSTCSVHRFIREQERKLIKQNKQTNKAKQRPLPELGLHDKSCGRTTDGSTDAGTGCRPVGIEVYDFTGSSSDSENLSKKAVSPPGSHGGSSMSSACASPAGSVVSRMSRVSSARSRSGGVTGGRRCRVPYSAAEVANLLHGVAKLGQAWSQILATYGFHASRTAVDLKEKHRRIMGQQHKSCSSSASPASSPSTASCCPFSMVEERRLQRGVRRLGYNWKGIRAAYRFSRGRTAIQLRNKWRAMHGGRRRAN